MKIHDMYNQKQTLVPWEIRNVSLIGQLYHPTDFILTCVHFGKLNNMKDEPCISELKCEIESQDQKTVWATPI